MQIDNYMLKEPMCLAFNKACVNFENLNDQYINNEAREKPSTCRYCGNKYSSESSMYRHMRSTCRVKIRDDKLREETKKLIYDQLIGQIKENEELELKNRKLELMVKNKKLENELKKIDENVVKPPNIIKTGSRVESKASPLATIRQKQSYSRSTETKPETKSETKSETESKTPTNKTNNKFVVIGFGKEDMTKIDNEDIIKSITGFYTPIGLIEAIYFNPKYPEYHNIYISNVRSQHAIQFNGKEWTLVLKNDLIDILYSNMKDYAEENFDEIAKSLSESKKSALLRFINLEDGHKKIKEVKQKINLLLYNKRAIPLETHRGKITKVIVENKTAENCINESDIIDCIDSNNDDHSKYSDDNHSDDQNDNESVNENVCNYGYESDNHSEYTADNSENYSSD